MICVSCEMCFVGIYFNINMWNFKDCFYLFMSVLQIKSFVQFGGDIIISYIQLELVIDYVYCNMSYLFGLLFYV